MNYVTLQLEQLTCPSCAKKIETVLKNQNGVKEVNILFNVSKAKINFDETIINLEEIKKVITNIGYQVLNVK